MQGILMKFETVGERRRLEELVLWFRDFLSPTLPLLLLVVQCIVFSYFGYFLY